MTRFRFTPQAFDDLFDIWTYIAQDNLDAANRVEEEIYNSCELLAHSPLAGTVRKDLTSLPVRFWLVPAFPNYFISRYQAIGNHPNSSSSQKYPLCYSLGL